MPKKVTKVSKVSKTKRTKSSTAKKSLLVPVTEAPKGDFNLSLELADRTLESFGFSVVECLNNFNIVLGSIKSKGDFVLKVGELKATKVMLPFEMRRLFTNSTSKIVFEKRMLSILK